MIDSKTYNTMLTTMLMKEGLTHKYSHDTQEQRHYILHQNGQQLPKVIAEIINDPFLTNQQSFTAYHRITIKVLEPEEQGRIEKIVARLQECFPDKINIIYNG